MSPHIMFLTYNIFVLNTKNYQEISFFQTGLKQHICQVGISFFILRGNKRLRINYVSLKITYPSLLYFRKKNVLQCLATYLYTFAEKSSDAASRYIKDPR